MTTTETAHPTRSTGRKLARFVGHYVEMAASMVVGMVALGPLWPSDWLARADVDALVMATNMTVAMGLWMCLRRHSWPRLVPHWLGALSGSALMMAGHVIMFPLMLVAMLWRRAEYWH